MTQDNILLFNPTQELNEPEIIRITGQLQAGSSEVSGWVLPDNVHTLIPLCAKRNSTAVTLADFYAHMETHNYIFLPTMKPWPASSVNARLGKIQIGVDDNGKPIMIWASSWLDKHRPIESMCWSPGDPTLIKDRFLSVGGWSDRAGIQSLNVYRPPILKHGVPTQAGPWIELLHKVYPDDAEHITSYFAHRVQHPGVKPNHALLLGGKQGIGKDTLLAALKEAVGPWNMRDVSPKNITEEKWNDYIASVVLRVNEITDLGDIDRYEFYEHMKVYSASPPDVIRCQEKYIRHYDVLNVCGVIYTTNHKTDGMYLPSDDRRHYVAWSNLSKEDFTEQYWIDLHSWYESGGYGHAAAYLASYDLSKFNPKAPPPKTQAFWEIVNANRAPENTDLSNVIEFLKNPDAVTLDTIMGAAHRHDMPSFATWLEDRRNRKKFAHRLEEAGYTAVINEGNKEGRWKIGGKNKNVYAKTTLSEADRIRAVTRLADAVHGRVRS